MTACGSSCHSLLPGQTWYTQTFRFVISRDSPASNSCPSTSRRDEINKLSNIVFFFKCMFYKKYRKLRLKWSLLRYIIWAEKFVLESVWKTKSMTLRRNRSFIVYDRYEESFNECCAIPPRRGCNNTNNTSEYVSENQRIALDWSIYDLLFVYCQVIRAKGESWLNSLMFFSFVILWKFYSCTFINNFNIFLFISFIGHLYVITAVTYFYVQCFVHCRRTDS